MEVLVWSGEAVKLILDELRSSGFTVDNEGIKVMWTPDEENVKKCIEFGENIAK